MVEDEGIEIGKAGASTSAASIESEIDTTHLRFLDAYAITDATTEPTTSPLDPPASSSVALP